MHHRQSSANPFERGSKTVEVVGVLRLMSRIIGTLRTEEI
jgi:hypothetical protein